ncbi:MAG: hypothetical protein KDA61_09495 [Planctomycetales bacterium]|nr:hypothetical protein [Planctomycetales bacterium]
MNPEPRKRLRAELLAQSEPARASLEQYRKETEVMLAQLEAGLRRERVASVLLWLFAVALSTSFLLLYSYSGGDGKLAALATAFIILIYASVELLKFFINRSRVEILRELKSIELKLIERNVTSKDESHDNA